jgi:hypothetical protein
VAVVARPGAMLHHPLFADGAESVRGFAPQQHNPANHERSGTEANPDHSAKMHASIIKNRADEFKHSRIRDEARDLRSCCNL